MFTPSCWFQFMLKTNSKLLTRILVLNGHICCVCNLNVGSCSVKVFYLYVSVITPYRIWWWKWWLYTELVCKSGDACMLFRCQELEYLFNYHYKCVLSDCHIDDCVPITHNIFTFTVKWTPSYIICSLLICANKTQLSAILWSRMSKKHKPQSSASSWVSSYTRSTSSLDLQSKY